MKNLQAFTGDCFNFYTSLVGSKRSQEVQLRLNTIETEIKTTFESYQDHFSRNVWSTLASCPTSRTCKDDLLALYKYSSKRIRNLKEEIRKLQPQEINSTCQFCTIDSVSSLDHIVPKDTFPEFAVNPINLLPCCQRCNSLKSELWRTDQGELSFINPYTDTLPQAQYLWVNIEKVESDIITRFSLENRSGIQAKLFSRIESHFAIFKLNERFREKSISAISELDRLIMASLKRMPLDVILNIISDKAVESKSALGHNHFQAVLELELIKSPYFLERFPKSDR